MNQPSLELAAVLQQAESHLGSGRLSDAHQAFQSILDWQPQHLDARRGLVRVLLLQRNGALAGQHARTALEHSRYTQAPHGAPVDWWLVGECLLACGEWEQAQRWLQQHSDELRRRGDAPAVLAAMQRTQRHLQVLQWRGIGPLSALGDVVSAWHTDQSTPHPVYPGLDTQGTPKVQTGDAEWLALLTIHHTLALRHQACDWRRWADWQHVTQRVLDRLRATPDLPVHRSLIWYVLQQPLSMADLQILARAACRTVVHALKPTRLWSTHQAQGRLTAADKRLKVAYVSLNFNNHPTTQLVVQVLRDHDRRQIEVCAYGLAPSDGSALRVQIESNVDQFIDMSGQAPEAVARRLLADGVDIMVGMVDAYGPALDVMLWHPAPVVLNFQSFGSSLGCGDMIDAHISDAVSIPPEVRQWYDERVVDLPGGYYGYNSDRPLHTIPSRASVGLPDHALVLSGFNNSYKIEPDTFAAWCEILRQLPDSVLWLYTAHGEQAYFLQQEAARQGIAPNRLIFAPRIDPDAHLARLGCIDLQLDTFIYNAHTTMLDVLFAGVPALTRYGHTTTGRLASSYLLELGLQDCVTYSTDEFIERAVTLAKDPMRRALIQQQLMLARHSQGPFNTAQRARQLESLYRRLWQDTLV